MTKSDLLQHTPPVERSTFQSSWNGKGAVLCIGLRNKPLADFKSTIRTYLSEPQITFVTLARNQFCKDDWIVLFFRITTSVNDVL